MGATGTWTQDATWFPLGADGGEGLTVVARVLGLQDEGVSRVVGSLGAWVFSERRRLEGWRPPGRGCRGHGGWCVGSGACVHDGKGEW